jgi:transcriptional regulator with XRE-family HTH domain
VIDQVEQGRRLRALRKAANKGLREVAAIIGYSPAYLSDLELGRRQWNEYLIERFKQAVRA